MLIRFIGGFDLIFITVISHTCYSKFYMKKNNTLIS